MNYTKGEWIPYQRGQHNVSVCVLTGNTVAVEVTSLNIGLGSDVAAANACLIAAAPDMYEALKSMKDAVISYHGSEFLAGSAYQPLTNALGQVRQALAKAEGREA